MAVINICGVSRDQGSNLVICTLQVTTVSARWTGTHYTYWMSCCNLVNNYGPVWIRKWILKMCGMLHSVTFESGRSSYMKVALSLYFLSWQRMPQICTQIDMSTKWGSATTNVPKPHRIITWSALIKIHLTPFGHSQYKRCLAIVMRVISNKTDLVLGKHTKL